MNPNSTSNKLENHLRAAFASVLAGNSPRVAVPDERGGALGGLRLESGAALEAAKNEYLKEYAEEYAEGNEREDFVSIDYTAHPVWLTSDDGDLAMPLPFNTVDDLLVSDVIRSYLNDALESLDEPSPHLGKGSAPGA